MSAPNYFRLTHITFAAGPSVGSPPSELEPGVVTLCVGPNNAGKSLALRELHSWAAQASDPPRPWPGGRVLADVNAKWPEDIERLEAFLQPRLIPDQEPPNGYHLRTFPLDQTSASGRAFVHHFAGYANFEDWCRTRILPNYVARLDGRSRFNLAEARQLTSLRDVPSNHLMALLLDDTLRANVAAEIMDVFGLHLVIDTTTPPNLNVALSSEPPPAGDWQRSIDDTAVAYMSRATPLLDFSDGVKMYVGLVSAVESVPHVLLLIDEPEAFLHPTLARQLGARLAKTARERGANVVAATHSAEFLIGCVGEVPQTDVVRLTYEGGVATARPLPGAELEKLVRDPLLRSTHALQALFARAAVVCEADSDRAFYDEINRRLVEAPGRRGSHDTVFLNAQNWQTLPRIAGPLRRLGIPAAMILDLDTLIQDGWKEHFQAVGVADDHLAMKARATAAATLKALGKHPDDTWKCKRDGLAGLDNDGRHQVENALQELRAIGIFVVPVGELENWLTTLGVTNKRTWVTQMLQRLGAPGENVYVTPGAGDVWEFLEEVAMWIANPNRLGMPT